MSGSDLISIQSLASLRAQIVDIIAGTVFVFVGMAACSIAAVRRESGTRFFILLGIWSAMYGAMQLTQQPIIVAACPHWLQRIALPANTTMTYFVVVAAALAFRELSLGPARWFSLTVAGVGLFIAIVGVAIYLATGSTDAMIPWNNLLAAVMLAVLTLIVAVPRLSATYLALPSRGVLAFGTWLFAMEALFVNLLRPLGLRSPQVLDHLGFAIFLFSLSYGGLKLVLANERRLLSIENELAIAREIQTSILPNRIPDVDHLRIAATYRPMTAVAGDFYDFIGVGHDRLGLLVADVSGHGVPAALIASMIKVAVQLIEPCAQDPRAVLCGLNRALSGQLRGQFVSAAYLWLDTTNRIALYSAAGHPPLLRWTSEQLKRVESNGLLFGVGDGSDNYPVQKMRLCPGDRFLLYTDGVTEPENTRGESFGDVRLEQLVRENRLTHASGLSDRLISEIRLWQPPAVTQQDDITLLVVDVM